MLSASMMRGEGGISFEKTCRRSLNKEKTYWPCKTSHDLEKGGDAGYYLYRSASVQLQTRAIVAWDNLFRLKRRDISELLESIPFKGRDWHCISKTGSNER